MIVVRGRWVKLADAAVLLGRTYQVTYNLALSGQLERRRNGAGSGWLVSVRSVKTLRDALSRGRKQPASGTEEPL